MPQHKPFLYSPHSATAAIAGIAYRRQRKKAPIDCILPEPSMDSIALRTLFSDQIDFGSTGLVAVDVIAG